MLCQVSSQSLPRSLAVLFAINVLNFYDRQVLGALLEPIRKEFHLSDTQLGALGTWPIVVYALVGLPLGRRADAGSRKRLLAAGMAVWASLTGLGSVVESYLMLLVSRLGVYVGEAACAPAATSWIGDLFPAERRSRALAIFMLGVPLGGALSYAISGPVAQAWGWRAALVVAAVPAVLLIPALLGLPEPPRGASETRRTEVAAPSVWSILRIPTMWWIIASGALVNFNLYALATFFPAFLTRYHGLSVGQAGLWSGVGYGVAGVAGGLSAGAWGDRVLHARKDGRMLSAAAAALIAAPLALIGIRQPAGAAAASIACIMIAYGFLNMYYGLVYSAIHDVVAPAVRGSAMAVYFLAMYLCGASFGPLLTGRLSDYLARSAAQAAGAAAVGEAYRAIGLHQAMYVIPVLSMGLALVLYGGSRTVAADMAQRDEGHPRRVLQSAR
ncbi:MAG TPA: MFS transporter [Bryobacteraceae bacterium]|jgi:predicted MFS family arabinose efflux permease|nr:MFS transporter [Bryobacteraceae bacterium]